MTNIVAGRILEEGNHQGISDLLVILYDIDPSPQYQELLSVKVSGVDDPIESLFLEPKMRTWLDFPGDRIGSVLSDQRGWFELSFTDEAYRVRNTEHRPDLVLYVLGPDRAVGSTVASRLLHYAFIPRVNAGRTEHYVITIPSERLQKKGAFLPSTRLDPTFYLTSRRKSIELTSQFKTHTNTLIREQLAPRLTQQARFRTFRKALGNKLLQTQTSLMPYYVPRTTPVRDTYQKAVSAGVTNLGNKKTGPGIKLWLAPTGLRQEGIDPDALQVGETVEVSVCDLLAQKGLSGELRRIRSLLDEKRIQKLANDVGTSEPEEGNQLPEEDTDTGESEEASPSTFITERILGQLAELPELKEEKTKSTIQELQKIKETINELELSGGPANVTAFHDFHTLQVAFQDVWTASFDANLHDRILDLYRETVALHEDYEVETFPMEDIDDVNALREYLATLRDEVLVLEIELVPPDIQECFPKLTKSIWNRLNETGKAILETALRQDKRRLQELENNLEENASAPLPHVTATLRSGIKALEEKLDATYETAITHHLTSPLSRIERLILEIEERLNKPYAFKYFAPGTINYGILVTYRQEWMPDTYQVGRLVSTIPLAPGEERKLKVTRKVNKSRAEKAVEKALIESTSERQFTSRTELDVMAKVSSSTNFRMTAQGTFNIGIGQISTSSQFSNNQQQQSTQQKKQFLEAIQKSAERVRQETEIHVETNQSFEDGIESDTVLKNPNNELTVTYLLYELERRYRITSRPHRLTPVVLVAMDIPAPHEINETWILEHSWILKRVLLDDQFLDALFYLEDGLTADSVDIEIKKANWDAQRSTLAELESQFERMIELRDKKQDTIAELLENEKLAKTTELDDGQRAAAAAFTAGLSELFGGGTNDRDEVFKARREGAEKALEFLKERTEALSERVSLARKAITETAEVYSAAVKNKARKDSTIRQLQLHLRQNILHYMHAIWDYKHHDQQFFELNDLEVPFLESATQKCRLRLATDEEIEQRVPGLTAREGALYVVSCDPPVPPLPTEPLPKRRLGAVADLNRPLGYKGNYIIYPLKGCSYLTDYMSQDYVDDYFGLRDPATQLGYTGEELLSYANEVLNDSKPALTPEERETLLRAVVRELSNPTGASETVILPTGQLYMEALKGEQSLLEDFKLAHRGLDVLKVQEEVRESRLENLRRGLRMVSETPDLEDPEIEKTIWVREGRGVQVPVVDVEES